MPSCKCTQNFQNFFRLGRNPTVHFLNVRVRASPHLDAGGTGLRSIRFCFGGLRLTYQIKLISPIQNRIDIIAEANRRPAQFSSVFPLIYRYAKNGRKEAQEGHTSAWFPPPERRRNWSPNAWRFGFGESYCWVSSAVSLSIACRTYCSTRTLGRLTFPLAYLNRVVWDGPSSPITR